MSMGDFVEAACDRHGLERHIHVHEAGHAVAAIDFGVAFKQVTLYADDGGPRFDGGLYHAAAGVEMHSADPTTWVPHDRIASLRFLLAGTMTETALLGHAIEDGYKEDFNVWRRGLGKTGGLTRDQLDDLAGGDFFEEVHSAEIWAKDNRDRIERVASRLSELSRPGTISYEEIRDLLDCRDG